MNELKTTMQILFAWLFFVGRSVKIILGVSIFLHLSVDDGYANAGPAPLK